MANIGVDIGSVVGENEHDLVEKLEQLNRCLSADSKAVTSCNSLMTINRSSSKTSLVSSLSDGSGLCDGDSSNNSHLSVDKKHNRWPSFSNAFPSFINIGSNAALPSTTSLCQQWNNVISNWEQYSKKKSVVSDLIRMGIPDELRPIIWQLVTGAYDSPLKQTYHKYLHETSPFERAITRDISRTYPKHEFFKEKGSAGQQSLFNVMKAYSLYDREVGYCQGSGFIVGLLLMQMPEEEAFAVLVQLMQEYRLRELYKPCMTELGVCMHQLEGLIAEHLPELQRHFVAQAFAPSHYASAWILTLFATAFPVAMTTRVMDLFIAEGIDFILRLSLAILKQFAPRLLTMDMETMIFSLQQTDSTEWEDHGRTLFETALTLKLNPRRLKKLRNEYITARSQEQAEQIEVRRLRTENGLLLQRLARLEEDNTYLAKQLVDCNVERAELSHEVSRLRGCIARLQAAAAATASSSNPTEAVEPRTPTPCPAPLLPPPPPPHNGAATEAVEMKATAESEEKLSNGSNQTATPSPHLSERDQRVSDTQTRDGAATLSSGVESWASNSVSVSFSPSAERRDPNSVGGDHLLVETIRQLETELVFLRVREADCHCALRDAKERIRLLEENVEKAVREREEQVEILHSELMKVKLREAEGLLRQKELQDRVQEIQNLWNNHLSLMSVGGVGNSSSSTGGGAKIDSTAGTGFLRASAGLIQSKLRNKSAAASVADNAQHLSDRLLETKLYCQIAELQKKVNELTTQVDLADRKLMRRDEQVTDLTEKVERFVLRETALRAELKEAECRCVDLESKRKSDAILWRIREIELSSQLAEMQQHFSELNCLHDVEHASQTLRDNQTKFEVEEEEESERRRGGMMSNYSSVAPTPDLRTSRTTASNADRLSTIWKDLPPAIMTESIGPLEDLCLLPDDPLITSIYMQD